MDEKELQEIERHEMELPIPRATVLRLVAEARRQYIQLAPNPKCTKGLHPMACADETDPQGQCLWCVAIEELEAKVGWLQKRILPTITEDPNAEPDPEPFI